VDRRSVWSLSLSALAFQAQLDEVLPKLRVPSRFQSTALTESLLRGGGFPVCHGVFSLGARNALPGKSNKFLSGNQKILYFGDLVQLCFSTLFKEGRGTDGSGWDFAGFRCSSVRNGRQVKGAH
jgi:hypothetical protein